MKYGTLVTSTFAGWRPFQMTNINLNQREREKNNVWVSHKPCGIVTVGSRDAFALERYTHTQREREREREREMLTRADSLDARLRVLLLGTGAHLPRQGEGSQAVPHFSHISNICFKRKQQTS